MGWIRIQNSKNSKLYLDPEYIIPDPQNWYPGSVSNDTTLAKKFIADPWWFCSCSRSQAVAEWERPIHEPSSPSPSYSPPPPSSSPSNSPSSSLSRSPSPSPFVLHPYRSTFSSCDTLIVLYFLRATPSSSYISFVRHPHRPSPLHTHPTIVFNVYDYFLTVEEMT